MDISNVFVADILCVADIKIIDGSYTIIPKFLGTRYVYKEWEKNRYVDLENKQIYKKPSMTSNIGDICINPYTLVSARNYLDSHKDSLSRKTIVKKLSSKISR